MFHTQSLVKKNSESLVSSEEQLLLGRGGGMLFYINNAQYDGKVTLHDD